MRAGRITENDVFKEADSILMSGVAPSALNVRERLGRGSNSTIQKHLGKWRSANQEALKSLSKLKELPDELENLAGALLNQIWGIALNLSQGQFDSQREAWEKAQGELQEIIESKTVEIKTAQSQLKSDANRIRGLEKEKRAAVKQVQKLEDTIHGLKVDLSSRIGEAKALKAENARIYEQNNELHEKIEFLNQSYQSLQREMNEKLVALIPSPKSENA